MGRSPTGGVIYTEDINSNKQQAKGGMINITKKGPWTPEEDRMLVDYIEIHGHGSWRALPKLAGLNRCGKSCRLRWTNYLRPDIRRGNFTEDEEKLIIHLHSLLGNKWSAIATRLSGRTDNEIKNYWNTHLKKKLLQMGIDPVTHQPLPTTNDLHHLLASAANLNLPQLLSLLLSNNQQLITTPSSNTNGGYGMLNSSSSLHMDGNINATLMTRSRPPQYYPDAHHFARAQSMVKYNSLLQFLSSPAAAASTNSITTTPVPIIEAITGCLFGSAVPLVDDNHQLLEYLTGLVKNQGQPNQLLGLSLCNDGTPSGLPDPNYPSSFPSLEELLQQCSSAATCNANTNYSARISNSTSCYQLPTSGTSSKTLTDRIGLLATGGGGGDQEKYDHVGSSTSCSSSIIPRFDTSPALVPFCSLKPTANIASSTEVFHDDQTSISSKAKPRITHDSISRSNPASSTISTTFNGWEDHLMDDEASRDHDHESYWRDLIECNIACLPTGFNSKYTTRGSSS